MKTSKRALTLGLTQVAQRSLSHTLSFNHRHGVFVRKLLLHLQHNIHSITFSFITLYNSNKSHSRPQWCERALQEEMRLRRTNAILAVSVSVRVSVRKWIFSRLITTHTASARKYYTFGFFFVHFIHFFIIWNVYSFCAYFSGTTSHYSFCTYFFLPLIFDICDGTFALFIILLCQYWEVWTISCCYF